MKKERGRYRVGATANDDVQSRRIQNIYIHIGQGRVCRRWMEEIHEQLQTNEKRKECVQTPRRNTLSPFALMLIVFSLPLFHSLPLSWCTSRPFPLLCLRLLSPLNLSAPVCVSLSLQIGTQQLDQTTICRNIALSSIHLSRTSIVCV